MRLSSDQAATPGGFTVAAAGAGPSSQPAIAPPSCVEIERRQLNVFDLPPEICNVILAARCPLTKTVYACRDKFVAWCAEKLIDPLSAPLSQVLLFALSLACQGLSLGTVKVYLSTLLAFLRLPDQPSLFKSLVVTHFRKGLQYTFPPAPFVMPQWDLNLVLTFLMRSPFEPMHRCSLRRLTFKTVFL